MNTIEVSVKAGYRIHMGFYRFSDYPLIYGALGAAIENPRLTVNVRECNSLAITCETDYTKSLVKDVINYLGLSNVCVEVTGYVKHHVGLGSTTRIVLATLVGLSTLKRFEIDAVEAAYKLGRGKVSSVGIYTFMYGNLVIDSGLKLESNEVRHAKPLTIIPIPKDWYVVIAVPEDIKGPSEDEERKIMSNVKEFMDQNLLYRYILRLMSAAIHRDFKLFTDSLHNIQLLTGKYFSEYQGGIFCCDISQELADIMMRLGLRGIGQSSWGPTIYGFTNSYLKAIEARNTLLNYFQKIGVRGKVWVTNIPNTGHRIDIIIR